MIDSESIIVAKDFKAAESIIKVFETYHIPCKPVDMDGLHTIHIFHNHTEKKKLDDICKTFKTMGLLGSSRR